MDCPHCQAKNTNTVDIITTDKEPALATAIDEVFGNGSEHRTSKYLHNRMEANHCSAKGRINGLCKFWAKLLYANAILITAMQSLLQH